MPKQPGTCGPASRGRIICSISKLTIAAGSSPSETRGTFISSGTVMPGWVTRPQRRHAAAMDAFPDGEAVQLGAGLDRGSSAIAYLPDEQAIGQPMRQAVGANPAGRRLDVVRHAAIGDLARHGIEHRKRRRRIAVARLPDRADHREPAPAAEQLHGTPEVGTKLVIFAADDIE